MECRQGMGNDSTNFEIADSQLPEPTQEPSSPLISVIISAHNTEASIGKSLDSLLNQPYRNLEIIVVDQGSTDDTAVVLERYHDRMRYLYQPDDFLGGSGQAVNATLPMARGEYVHCLTAGDLVTETYYIRGIQAFNAHPHIGAVVTDAYRIGEHGALMEIVKRGHFRTQQEFLLEALDHNPITASTLIVKRFCYDAVGLYRPEWGPLDDYEFSLRLGAQFEIAYLPAPLIQCPVTSPTADPNHLRTWSQERRMVREYRRKTAIETIFPELRRQAEPERYAQAHERLGRIFTKKGWHEEAEQEFELADSFRGPAAQPAAPVASKVAQPSRILFVLHEALPVESTATTLRPVQLAHALKSAGHEVEVLYPNYESTQPEGSLRAGQYMDLKTYAMAINASDFTLSARNGVIAESFRTFLQTHRFDFVHFQHLFHLGSVLLDEARKQDLAMVQDLQVLLGSLTKSPASERLTKAPIVATGAEEMTFATVADGSAAAETPTALPPTACVQPAIATGDAPSATAGTVQINVALYSLDQPEWACPIVRLISPLTASPIATQFKLNHAVISQDGVVTVKDFVKDAHIVVVQRNFPRVESAGKLVDHAKRLGKPVVYEIDDNLIELSATHPEKAFHETHRENLIRIASEADAVTVSTPKLKELFLKYNPNVTLLPNLIDLNLWSHSPKPRSDSRMAIIYMGTLTHDEDLAMIAPALKTILQKYQDRVIVRFWGYVPPALRYVPGVESVGHMDNNYRNFARRFCQDTYDIAVAPLVDNEFNRCKSHIKYLEYSACRIPGVYSRLEPYTQTVQHGITGLLAGSSPDEWASALERLIEDEAYRQRLAANAYQDVVKNHAIGPICQEWATLYRSLLKGEPSRLGESTVLLSESAAKIKVSVIIPVYNKAGYTGNALEALFRNTGESNYEVLVVDNGSTDETPAMLASYKTRVRLIRNDTNLGFAQACNQGARAARGEYFVFLNNDTLPQPGWLDELVALIEKEPQAGIIGSKLLYPNDTVQHAGVIFSESRRLPYHIYRNFDKNHPAVSRVREYPAVTAACMLVKRSVFFEAGLFDENYMNCYEDVDLCLKVRELGYKILYNPRSVVYHFESVTDGRKDQSNLDRSILTFHSKWDHQMPNGEQQYYADDDLLIEYIDANNLKIFPMSEAAQRVNMARRLKNHGQFQHALQALETVSDARHGFEVNALIGDCCANLGETVRAQSAYEQAIGIDPQSEYPYVGLAVLAVRAGRLHEAKEVFEKALTLNPKSDRALCGLGIVLASLGQTDLALEKYSQALDINPQNMTALSNLQACSIEGKTFGLAEHYFNRYLAQCPGDLGARFGLAGLLHLSGDLPRARETLQHILKLNPAYEDAVALLDQVDGASAAAVS
ncbi:MAG: glycosyltransferase [Acidobacteria bacterium]|nr:glycosyltransferase [Acidobacteriota bacterium]MBI3656468.1 glycosyltransferase [Acidobacteriota bacterium]